MSQKCTATTKEGNPCKAWAVADTSPARCAAHGGGRPVGAPAGNRNAETHGLYSSHPPDDDPLSTRALISEMSARIARFMRRVDRAEEDGKLELEALGRYLDILSQAVGRLVRAQRAERGLHGDKDELDEAHDEVLDYLSRIWGIEL